MIDTVEKCGVVQGIRYFGPACVIENGHNNRIRVLLNNTNASPGLGETWAQLALPSPVSLVSGDTVLVAGEEKNNFYIIGILDAEQINVSSDTHITTRCGARAEVKRTEQDERLRIISKKGVLIYEYDPLSGKSYIAPQTGDLEIASPDGNIEITASQSLRLKSNNLEISSNRGKFTLDEADFNGGRFTATLHTYRIIAERLESTVTTVIEKAKNMYTAVKELTQVSSGRLRTLVEGTWQAKSKKAFLKADDDFKVKGNKIYLG